MDGSDDSRRLVPALEKETGFWGTTWRVVVGPGEGTEVGRICPRCGEESTYKRSQFLEQHGKFKDGTEKCPDRHWRPYPDPAARAGAGAAAAAIAAPGTAAGAELDGVFEGTSRSLFQHLAAVC